MNRPVLKRQFKNSNPPGDDVSRKNNSLLPQGNLLHPESFTKLADSGAGTNVSPQAPVFTNLSDIQSQDGETNTKRKETDKLDFEPWRQIARCRSWKTPFRSEVITASTHPRQVTEWLTEVDTATEVADLDDMGFVVRSSTVDVETLDSKIATGIMKILTQEFRRKAKLAEELKEKEKLPMLTGRQIAVMIYQYLKRYFEHRVAQRRSQDVRPELGRDTDSHGKNNQMRISWKVSTSGNWISRLS